jgi:hypothetical protein
MLLKVHVAIVCFKCFKYFLGMLQVLYIDVAHVVMAINVCFKCMFQMNAASVYLNVAKVDPHVVYTCMLQAYVSSVIRCFICMLASVSSGCCICL